jgi:hypothetical protein
MKENDPCQGWWFATCDNDKNIISVILATQNSQATI